MQNSVNPGYRNPLLKSISKGKKLFSAIFILLFIGGFQYEANALPPGVPDFTHPDTKLIVMQDLSPADNTSKNIVIAQVVDSDGNPVNGVTVYFTPAPGSVTVSVVTGTAGAGRAELQLASAAVGPVVINARIGSTHFNPTVTVTFTAFQPSAATSVLQIVNNGANANGSATNGVVAIVRDADGNPVANQSVTFNITSGTGSFTGPVTLTTNANGEAFITLTSNVVGGVTIEATINGSPNIIINNTVTVQFTTVTPPPVVNTPTTELIVVVSGSLANGTATNSVRAHITDGSGNPLAGQTVVFTINSGTASTSALMVTTDASGNALLTLTSTVVGDVIISATVNGTPLINGNPGTVSFVSDAPSVSVPTTRLVVVNNHAPANDVALNTVKAVITDANGNPVAGQTVKFTLASGVAVFVGSTTLVTDANGEVVINLQSTVAGAIHITATVNDVPIVNGSPAELIFVAGPPDLTNPLTALVIDANDADADGIATNIVRAHIVDAFGNPVSAQTIVFNYTGTATASGPLTVTTDNNGDAILTLTSTTVGTVDVTATVNGTPIVNGSPATVRFTNYPDVVNPATELIVVTDNAFGDGTATNSVRAHVVDNAGNPMVGATVVFVIASGDATIVTPQPVVTDANGDAIILITSTKAGIVEITAKADGRDIINGSPAKIRFTSVDVWVPRVFTPNGDGTNDVIRPIVNGIFNLQYFNIYNRWGNLLFTTNNITQGWDGRFKGAMQPNETYLWIVVGTNANNQRVQKRGMLTLVR